MVANNTHSRTCPTCNASLTFEDSAKCPKCGRWLRLPAGLDALGYSEAPADLNASALESRSVPWKQLSPSIGFVLSLALMFLGLSVWVLPVLYVGATLAPVSVIGAAVLEMHANREAAKLEGDPAARHALTMSSDWQSRRGGRRRGQ